MPCRDDRDYQPISQADIDNTEKRIRAELEPLLCEACTFLENHHAMSLASKELQSWYKAHDKREEHRVRLETALKLSEKERRILGIDLEALRRASANAKCE
jgi:hypothetical protein